MTKKMCISCSQIKDMPGDYDVDDHDMTGYTAKCAVCRGTRPMLAPVLVEDVAPVEEIKPVVEKKPVRRRRSKAPAESVNDSASQPSVKRTV